MKDAIHYRSARESQKSNPQVSLPQGSISITSINLVFCLGKKGEYKQAQFQWHHFSLLLGPMLG